MASESRSLCLVGTIPRPIGGVAVHVSRLAALCSQSGYRTTIYDLHPGPAKQVPAGCIYESRPTQWRAAASYLGGMDFGQYDIVHVHASRLRTFLFLHARFLTKLHRLERLVVTFHSGTIPEDLFQLSRVEIRWLRRILDSSGKIITVSSRQSEALRTATNIDTEKFAVIPAYLPISQRLPAPTPALPITRAGREQIVVVSGYGTPLYGWQDLLGVIERLPSEWKWVFCFYNIYHKQYYAELRRACARLPNIHCLTDLEPDSFQAVLRSADVYVRPTKADGDSIALREALALGLRCIASDVVPRPLGVTIYPLDNLDALYRAFLESASIRPVTEPDTSCERILTIYEGIHSPDRRKSEAARTGSPSPAISLKSEP
jgi:glycosyltransferase involved in cell wall biosynthesis